MPKKLIFEKTIIHIMDGNGEIINSCNNPPNDDPPSADRGGVRSFFVRLFSSRQHCTRLGNRLEPQTCVNGYSDDNCSNDSHCVYQG